MSKPYTDRDLSDIFDEDLIWRRKELSDMKSAIKAADGAARSGLLRALVAMTYAHWEGYIKTCANRYFEFLTLRRKQYTEVSRQFYVNSFLIRLGALHQTRVSIEARCKLVTDILDGGIGRFVYVNPDLIDTRSNLNVDVIKDICLICGVEGNHFEDERVFIDRIMLKRRNAIAHGQQELIAETEMDEFIAKSLSLMDHFRSLLENAVYTGAYLAT